jgi:predicted secreted protein
MDAGADNQFRNARLSCIAGPCPFTRVDSDAYTRGGQRISATVRNWSDTATFVLESEVFRSQLTDVTENSHPIVLGRGLTFTLPPTAQGPSIQAEVDGTEVVFPLGPNALLSWATCEVRNGSDRNRTFRCVLKPGYAFKKDESP